MSLARLLWATFLGLSLSAVNTTVAYADSSETQSQGQVLLFNTPIQYETIPELFGKAFNYESGNFFQNDSMEAQLELIFGIADPFSASSFPENEISRDAELVDIFYQDYMQQLTGNTPIRTRDLENPYTTSVNSLESSR